MEYRLSWLLVLLAAEYRIAEKSDTVAVLASIFLFATSRWIGYVASLTAEIIFCIFIFNVTHNENFLGGSALSKFLISHYSFIIYAK